MSKFIFNTLMFGIASFIWMDPSLFAVEKDSGFAVVDKEPWKQSWVQEEDGHWKLTLLFDKAAIFTFFKERPKKSTFLGLSENNKPIRQEIVIDPEKPPIILTDSQFERFGDGAICWAFQIEKSFSRDEQHFFGITTAIIDDPAQYNDEYRYNLWR